MEPFAKYAGGKRRLADTILESIPGEWKQNPRSYHEPFLGGGAVFLRLATQFNPTGWCLSDLNSEFIRCWQAIQSDPVALMNEIDALPKGGEREYYEVRSRISNTGNLAKDAARTLYLNKLGFNGLYRIGPHGFNVPFGKDGTRPIYDRQNLMRIHSAISDVSFACQDFERSFDDVKAGDFVYCDPPYLPTAKNSFRTYVGKKFDYQDHARLAACAVSACKRGAWVIISNVDSPWAKDTFSDFDIRLVSDRRVIGGTQSSRSNVSDILILGGPGIKARRARHARK